VSYSSVRASLSSVLSGPPRTFDKRNVLLSTLFLTAMLVAAVPMVAISTPVPLLALIAIAGLCYAAVLVFTDTVFEGLCGAVFVLCTFSANLPLLEQQPIPDASVQLNFLLVDFVVIPLAGLLLWWNGGFSLPSGRRLDTVVSYALVGLVVWSALAAVVSNGPSRFAAVVFVTTQIRYLLLFGVAVGVVRYTGLRTALYSLLVALGGNIAYAIAEVLNRGSFGLSYLGDAAGVTLNPFSIGPWAFSSSMYAGGFVGSSRALTTLVILLSPLVVERIVNGTTVQRLLGATYLLGSVFVVRASGSDAGWAAFLLVVLGAVLVLSYLVLDADVLDSASETIGYLYGYACTLGAGLLVFVLYTNFSIFAREQGSGDTGESSGSTEGSEASSSDTQGGGASSSNAQGGAASSSNAQGGAASSGSTSTEASSGTDTQSTSEFLLDLMDAVPFVSTSSLPIRFKQYAAALDIGLTYPLFGLGGRNFLFIAESYMSRPVSIHNMYLAYLAATGIPGALLLLSGLVAVWLISVAETVQPSSGDRLLWGTVACGLLGFYAYNFWTSGHLTDPTLMTFWLLAGLIVGTRRRVGRDERTPNSLAA
jgi:hypothetical protein